MAQNTLYQAGLEAFRIETLASIKDKDSKAKLLLDSFLARRDRPEDALESAKSLKQDVDKKYGDRTVSIGGGKVKIESSWISSILGNLQKFIAVGDFVMKKAPETVGMAWFAISLGLTAIQSNYQLYSMFGTGLADMANTMVLITNYDRIYDERGQPGFKDSDLLRSLFDDISTTYSAMLSFAYGIHKHLSAGRRAKMLHIAGDFFNTQTPVFQGMAARIAGLKKKVMEKSEVVFEAKTLEHFGEIQTALKSNVEETRSFQKTSEEFYHAQLLMQEEIKATLKRPTRWDYAITDYDNTLSKLNPMDRMTETLSDSLSEKLDGTGAWIFTDPTYDSWINSTTHSMLCISGREGTGKSVLLASVFEELDTKMDEDNYAVQYLSCAMVMSSADSSGSPLQVLTKINNTLISQLYEMATMDQESPTLLENCNKILSTPEQTKTGKGSQPHTSRDDSIPDLPNALRQLTLELKRQVIIVLDAVDRLRDADQEKLFNSLRTLIQDQAEQKMGRIRVLVGCRPNSKFSQLINGQCSVLDIESPIKSDITLKLDRELESFSWTDSQRTETKEAILKKSHCSFKYLVQIAIPFLQEPYQGRLSERLKKLPDSMGQTYAQAIRATPPAYMPLLHTALSWTLVSPQPMRVVEIMDAFNSIYSTEPSEEDLKAAEELTMKTVRSATDLEVDQLRKASGPFLNIRRDDVTSEWVVELEDQDQVRQFFMPPNDKHALEKPVERHLCADCGIDTNQKNNLTFSERDLHLQQAITCVQQLCNPLFWARHWRAGEPTAPELEEEAPKEAEVQAEVSANVAQDGAAAAAAGGETAAENITLEVGATNGLRQDSSEVEAHKADDENKAKDEGGVDQAKNDQCDSVDDEKKPKEQVEPEDDPCDSVDDEDVGKVAFKQATEESKEEPETSTNKQWDQQWRYTMMYWFYHIQKAEELWSTEEIADHPQWKTLFSVLDKLVFDHPKEFIKTQIVLLWRDDNVEEMEDLFLAKAWKPLHIAAYLGLVNWARYLIEERDQDIQCVSFDRTPLQAASKGGSAQRDMMNMLRFLLDKGTNPDFQNENRMPLMHSMLLSEQRLETFDLFINRGTRLDAADIFFEWTVLHYYADAGCKDLAIFERILNKTDPSNQPNINAKNNLGETPLHVLLERRNLGLDVLEAFLTAGADPNIDDSSSKQPLRNASERGQVEIIKFLMPYVKDVDDIDDHGRTALHRAAELAFAPCVEVLLEKAAPNLPDHHNRTPFFCACLAEKSEAAAVLLAHLRRKELPVTDIIQVTKRERTALRQAAAHGFDDIVRELLEMIRESKDASANALIDKADSRKKRTALHCAAFNGREESVKLLLAHGATSVLTDKEGKTALELACSQWVVSADERFESIIEILIDHDPLSAIKDSELISAAASNGSRKLLEKLHTLGAPLDRADRFGWTPLELAHRFGNSSAEEFLARLNALPLRWPTTEEETGDKISFSPDGLTITYTLPADRATIITETPLPAGLNKFYFEITSQKPQAQKGPEGEEIPPPDQVEFPEVAIGFCTLGEGIRFPGWLPDDKAPFAKSWAYHGDEGLFLRSDKQGGVTREEYKCRVGDTLGAGVDLQEHKMWITRNGELLDTGDFFERVRGRVFPCVGVFDTVELVTNFGGKEFLWKGGKVGEEREKIEDGGEEEKIEGKAEVKIEDEGEEKVEVSELGKAAEVAVEVEEVAAGVNV